jgi:transposase
MDLSWNDGEHETPVVRRPVVKQATAAFGKGPSFARRLRAATMPDSACHCARRTTLRDCSATRMHGANRTQCHSGLLGRQRRVFTGGIISPQERRPHFGCGSLRADASGLAREPARVGEANQSVDASAAGRGVLHPEPDLATRQHRVGPPSLQTHGRFLEARQALDHESGPTIRVNKKQRDRLIRLAAAHADWVLGFADEVWWSRLARPDLHAWADLKPVRLREMTLPNSDPDPKAIAGYGVLRAEISEVLVRFVDGRPVSHLTTACLTWICEQLTAEGKKVLALVWDNASWHISQEVRSWIGDHNRQAKRDGGVRILVCRLPVKSPWLNRIEPHWVHAKRADVEPARILTKAELIERICSYFNCKYVAHLQQTIAKKVA